MSGTDIDPEDANAAVAAPQPHVSDPWRAERAGGSPSPGRVRRWCRAGWLIIAIPAAISFVVGGYQIGEPSLWRDEAYTKDAIGRPISQIFALLGHQDAVHGAYYVLMHIITAAVGTSATALRFPSLCAMVVATGFVAAIGRRSAALALGLGAQGPAPDVRRPAPDVRRPAPDVRRPAPDVHGPAPDAWGPAPDVQGPARDARDPLGPALDAGRGLPRSDIPALTGLLAGLLFATAPFMTYYAQMARSYAIETMFATIASYLLLRAYPDGRWRWWSAYGAAVALTGLFNLFGLMILAAHGVTLLLTDARSRSPEGRSIGRIPLRWLAVSAAALVVLGPLLRVAAHEQEQIAWLTRPGFGTIARLLADLAGSRPLIIPFALLALAGLVAACLADDWRPLNPAAIALPWLVVPPFVLIAVSFVKPVYYVRYVEFCLPALSILAAAGLVGLIRFAAGTPLGRLRLAWLPAVLVVAGLAFLLAGPQHAIRQTSARPDNLRLASAIVAANEQPGDVVFYIPVDMHVLGTGYPAPFLRLRDIALAESPTVSATLTGTEITSPALLKSRFIDVRRVWVITGASNYKFPAPSTPVDKEKMALLAGWRILHRWQAGEVMLTLFATDSG